MTRYTCVNLLDLKLRDKSVEFADSNVSYMASNNHRGNGNLGSTKP